MWGRILCAGLVAGAFIVTCAWYVDDRGHRAAAAQLGSSAGKLELPPAPAPLLLPGPMLLDPQPRPPAIEKPRPRRVNHAATAAPPPTSCRFLCFLRVKQ